MQLTKHLTSEVVLTALTRSIAAADDREALRLLHKRHGWKISSAMGFTFFRNNATRCFLYCEEQGALTPATKYRLFAQNFVRLQATRHELLQWMPVLVPAGQLNGQLAKYYGLCDPRERTPAFVDLLIEYCPEARSPSRMLRALYDTVRNANLGTVPFAALAPYVPHTTNPAEFWRLVQLFWEPWLIPADALARMGADLQAQCGHIPITQGLRRDLIARTAGVVPQSWWKSLPMRAQP